MAPKVTIGIRVDPDSIEPYKKIYGKVTEGQKIVYDTWLPLREKALTLLKDKFSVMEICYLTTVIGKIGYKPKMLLAKALFLYSLTEGSCLFEQTLDGGFIERILNKLEGLHDLELFFLFEYCYEFKYSEASIEEHGRKIGYEGKRESS